MNRLPHPASVARPRIFVGDREARLLGTRTYLIEGEPVATALVEIPDSLCHCGGDEEGHPMVTAVALESCGTDATGREVLWDVGVIVDIGDGADRMFDEQDRHEDGWWLELERGKS